MSVTRPPEYAPVGELVANVTAVVNTAGKRSHRLFALTPPLLHVFQCPPDGPSGGCVQAHVNPHNLPASVLPGVVSQLEFMGERIGRYHLNGAGNDDWDEVRGSPHRILRHFDRHVLDSPGLTVAIVALLRWSRCTGFVVLSCGDRGAAVHLYLSDRVTQRGTTLGALCGNRFDGHDEFRTRMLEIVEAFLAHTETRRRTADPVIARLIAGMRAALALPRYLRFGM